MRLLSFYLQLITSAIPLTIIAMTTQRALTDQEGTPVGVIRVTKATESCVKVYFTFQWSDKNSHYVGFFFQKYYIQFSELYLEFLHPILTFFVFSIM